jgi:hypothetical protein
MKSTRKIKKSIFAICEAATAMPVNPNNAAMIEIIKKQQPSKAYLFPPIVVKMRSYVKLNIRKMIIQ